ncbi:MAG TPA: hypothetical protein VL027_02005, partial [Spongiibacteraceae bacterium]|nr:hypothetical protein [Spongiibacteraceae bacterium]
VVMLSAWLVLLSPLPAGFLRLEQGLFDLFQGPANASSRLALLQLAAEDAPLVLAPWLDPALFAALEQRLSDDGRLLLDVSPAALARWVQAGPAPVPEAGRVERSREHRDTWRRWVWEGRVVAPVDLPVIPVSGGQPWAGHWPALPDWGIGSALAEAGRPGALLAWLAGLEGWRDWRWTGTAGLQLGQRRLPVAPGTRIVTARQTSGLVQALPARQAAAAAYRTPMAVLSADPARAQRLAVQAASLQAGRYAAQPPWADWLGRAVLLGAGLLGSLLIPRASAALAGLGLLALSLLVVAGQWLALQRAGLWLPLVPGLLWLLLLSPVLLGAGIARRERLALRARADHSDLQRGTWLLQQGRTDEAVAALGNCAPGTAWLDLMYEIGLAQERQRQYREAARTYGQISARRRRYRDAAARAQSLRRLGLEGGTPGAGSTLASTIALPAGSGLQLPQLGRYQLERELGRGAMGVVYRGRDARIDRAVALKTLNLGQFGAAEREAVKTRFYREATAAGRLDHP